MIDELDSKLVSGTAEDAQSLSNEEKAIAETGQLLEVDIDAPEMAGINALVDSAAADHIKGFDIDIDDNLPSKDGEEDHEQGAVLSHNQRTHDDRHDDSVAPSSLDNVESAGTSEQTDPAQSEAEHVDAEHVDAQFQEALDTADEQIQQLPSEQEVDTSRQVMGAQQGEMPFAIVAGKPITEIPKDLYIPPAALQVFLEAFEGPLDLLLYLIKRQNIDILDINVSEITKQYITYVDLMESAQFELAAEYLVMAAMLAEIKSRLLLPRSEEVEEEEDPRAMLIRRLQEYERFKRVAEDIDEIPRMGRDVFQGSANLPEMHREKPQPDIDLKELLLALGEVMRRSDMYESHHITRERLSTRERMSQVLETLKDGQFVPFLKLFNVTEGRLGVVVTFLAIMELIKETLVEIVQSEPFGPIHVKAKSV